MLASSLPTRTVKTEELTSGMVIVTSAWAAVVTDAYPIASRFSNDPTDYIQVDWTMVEVAPDADGNMPGHRVIGYSSDFTMANGNHVILDDAAAYFLALRDQTDADIVKLKADVQALKDAGADTADIMDAQLLVQVVRSQVMDLYLTQLCLALSGRYVAATDGYDYLVVGAGPGDELHLERPGAFIEGCAASVVGLADPEQVRRDQQDAAGVAAMEAVEAAAAALAHAAHLMSVAGDSAFTSKLAGMAQSLGVMADC